MKKNFAVKAFLVMALSAGLFLSACVSGPPVNMAENEEIVISLVESNAYSQVDKSFVRKMVPPDRTEGRNGEFLTYTIKATDKQGNPLEGIPLELRTVGDNNHQLQKTDTSGKVTFWEPFGLLTEKLHGKKSLPGMGSVWGPIEKDMTAKAYINPVGMEDCKFVMIIGILK